MLEARKKGSAAEVKEEELHEDRRRRVPVIGLEERQEDKALHNVLPK